MEGFRPLEAPFLRSISGWSLGTHRTGACAYVFVRPVNDRLSRRGDVSSAQSPRSDLLSSAADQRRIADLSPRGV